MQIEFERAGFVYPDGTPAMREVSLRIAPGERVAIAGVNGSGKTTLLKHLIGLLKPDAGVVRVNGEDTRVKTVAQLARVVGLSFQNTDEQLFSRTVRDEVAFGGRNLGMNATRLAEQVDAAMAMFGLSLHSAAHPYDLEPFERRLVALASVVAMDTPVLALDEPTLGQDDRALAMLASALDTLSRRGKTVILVSHNLDFCAEHCDRFIIMQAGLVVMDASARDALSRYEAMRDAQLELPQLAQLSEVLGHAGAALTVNDLLESLRFSRLENPSQRQRKDDL
jgi:energy-coupling factor transport system ATP-binding protein